MGAAGKWIELGFRRMGHVLLVACSTVAVALALPAFASEQQDLTGQTGRITLNIPSQPLGKALAAFGAATGFEVIVDGRQVNNIVSSPVVGQLSPAEALQRLLIGTGLTVRDYAPGNVRLVAAPVAEFSPATSPYASYFAAVQQMILQTVCRSDIDLLDSNRLAIMLWVAPSGAVARVKLLDTLGEHGRDAVLSTAFERSDVGAPPPAGLKQPITLIVRPLPSRGSRDCNGAVPELHRAAN